MGDDIHDRWKLLSEVEELLDEYDREEAEEAAGLVSDLDESGQPCPSCGAMLFVEHNMLPANPLGWQGTATALYCRNCDFGAPGEIRIDRFTTEGAEVNFEKLYSLKVKTAENFRVYHELLNFFRSHARLNESELAFMLGLNPAQLRIFLSGLERMVNALFDIRNNVGRIVVEGVDLNAFVARARAGAPSRDEMESRLGKPDPRRKAAEGLLCECGNEAYRLCWAVANTCQRPVCWEHRPFCRLCAERAGVARDCNWHTGAEN